MQPNHQLYFDVWVIFNNTGYIRNVVYTYLDKLLHYIRLIQYTSNLCGRDHKCGGVRPIHTMYS